MHDEISSHAAFGRVWGARDRREAPDLEPARHAPDEGRDKYQPFRPCWPDWRHNDARPVDRTIVEMPVTEQLVKTKVGLYREPSGVVRYSAVQGVKFRADAEDLLHIMRRQVPANAKVWSLHALQKAYQKTTRGIGTWERYNLPLHIFLSLFPRTFQLFGEDQFVRPMRAGVRSVAESEDEVMKRLAMARYNGFVHSHTPVEGVHKQRESRPEIQQTCAKAWYVPSSNAPSRRSSRPASAATASTRPTSAATSSRPSRPLSAISANRHEGSRPLSAQTHASGVYFRPHLGHIPDNYQDPLPEPA